MECDVLIIYKKLSPRNVYIKFLNSNINDEIFLYRIFTELDNNELNQIVNINISDIFSESLNNFLNLIKENHGKFSFEENNRNSTIKDNYIKKYRQSKLNKAVDYLKRIISRVRDWINGKP